MFLLDHPGFTIITDHRPLIKIFGDKKLRNIDNSRLFKMSEKILMYRFPIIYILGDQNNVANSLSPDNHLKFVKRHQMMKTLKMTI